MTPNRSSRISAFQRWSRATFTRDKLLDNLKSFVWVAPLTLMIWIYAEREQVNNDFKVNDVSIQLNNNDRSRFVEVEGPIQRVNLTLSGPLSNLENVRKELATDGIGIDVGNLLGPGDGRRTENVIDRIQDDPRFRQAGVTVVASQPAELTINVEAMHTTWVNVDKPPTVTNLDMSKTSFDPKQVQISGPESEFKDKKPPLVYADLTGRSELTQPGPHDLTDVLLKIDQPETSHLKITPSIAKARLEVRSTDVTWKIDSVPIVVTAPPKLLQTYYVDVQPPSVANVWVIGPPDQMKSASAEAELRVTNDDIGGSDLPRQLKYDLPDGVRLAPDHQEAQQPVKFTLVQRPGG